jgi:hypothetical protein
MGAVTDKAIIKGMKQEAALDLMKKLLYELSESFKQGKLPHDFPVPGVQFGVTDVQFSLCELDKYLRVKLGQGRPRSKFRASKDPL